MKRRNYVQLLAFVFLLASADRSCAASKLKKVHVAFTAEQYDDSGLPEIEADVKETAHYQVSFCGWAEEYYDQEGDGWYEEPENICVVELTADDGYQFRFSSSDGEKIRLSGMGAVLLKANQEDNGHTLRLTVRMEQLDLPPGPIESAAWNGCRARWSESAHAAGYRLQLLDSRGKRHYAETEGTGYDFAPLMLDAGIYRYKVRAFSTDGNCGEWTDGGSCRVMPETAEKNRNQYTVQIVNHKISEELAHTPDNNRIEYQNTGWQKTEEGNYWYRNCDGTYPQRIWQMIDHKWYYFLESGYMARETYITWRGREYYLSPEGCMLTEGRAPDGRWADQAGVLAALTAEMPESSSEYENPHESSSYFQKQSTEGEETL